MAQQILDLVELRFTEELWKLWVGLPLLLGCGLEGFPGLSVCISQVEAEFLMHLASLLIRRGFGLLGRSHWLLAPECGSVEAYVYFVR